MTVKNRSKVIGISLLASLFALIILAGSESFAQGPSRTTIGPDKGWLVLHGGGIGVEKENGPIHRFIALAGGGNASVVVVLTAIDLDVLTPKVLTEYKQWWVTGLGVNDVTFMDT